ncbi:hypothetical protein HanHA300_Chr07g0246491 [Helianthus annuus]|nr:hypothetical protein HanHA300_Chr07g0246491 [Helianthus annuus]
MIAFVNSLTESPQFFSFDPRPLFCCCSKLLLLLLQLKLLLLL